MGAAGARARRRIDWSVDDRNTSTRLALVEDDVDSLEVENSRLADELAGIRKILMGILVSVTTAAILLAVNAVVMGVGR